MACFDKITLLFLQAQILRSNFGVFLLFGVVISCGSRGLFLSVGIFFCDILLEVVLLLLPLFGVAGASVEERVWWPPRV